MQKVAELLKFKGSQVSTISQNETVFQALQIMSKKGIGALPVTDDKGHMISIVSERDYARKVVLEGRSSNDTLIKDIMPSTLYVVKLQTTLEECMAIMTEQRVRHLPVVQDGKLAGIVSIGDLLKAIITEQHIMIKDLEDYIQGKYP